LKNCTYLKVNFFKHGLVKKAQSSSNADLSQQLLIKMVGKNSEYRRAYTPGSDDYLRESYGDNLDYRILRRKTECWHSMDPFKWNKKDLSDVPSEVGIEVVERRPKGTPVHQYKHEMFKKNYSQVKDTKPAAAAKPSGDSKSEVSKSTLTVKDIAKIDAEEGNSLKLDIAAVVTPEEPEKKVQIEGKPKNPMKKPVNCNAPAARSKSAGKRAVTPIEVLEKRPPLVPYGCKDKDPEIARKKTYNVRASADIYPSALRAQKRREVETARKQKETIKINILEKQKEEFLAKLQKETSAWDTEYRSCFQNYENRVYQNNVANRLHPRRVWQCLYAP